MNLVVLFLTDVGPAPKLDTFSLEELVAEAAEREIRLVHAGKKSPDFLIQLPEGTKALEARIGFETAWRTVSGEPVSFIARSARNLAMSLLKGDEVRADLGLSRRGTSSGFVFMDTKGLERILGEECERIARNLGEISSENILLKKPIEQGDVLVVKRGKEEDDPSFARIARIIQECYRSIVGRPVNIAGRGMKALTAIQAVIKEHAPKMLADLDSMHGVRKEMESGGLA